MSGWPALIRSSSTTSSAKSGMPSWWVMTGATSTTPTTCRRDTTPRPPRVGPRVELDDLDDRDHEVRRHRDRLRRDEPVVAVLGEGIEVVGDAGLPDRDEGTRRRRRGGGLRHAVAPLFVWAGPQASGGSGGQKPASGEKPEASSKGRVVRWRRGRPGPRFWPFSGGFWGALEAVPSLRNHSAGPGAVARGSTPGASTVSQGRAALGEAATLEGVGEAGRDRLVPAGLGRAGLVPAAERGRLTGPHVGDRFERRGNGPAQPVLDARGGTGSARRHPTTSRQRARASRRASTESA